MQRVVFSVEAVDMGRVLIGAVVSDVTEAVELDSKDVLLPKANEEPEDDDAFEADDREEHKDEPDEDDRVEDDSDEDEEPVAKLFGDLGELFRKNFVITLGFDFGCCCC